MTVGALRACSRDPVNAVLSLIIDEMLPKQPHRAQEMAEFRDDPTLSDVEGPDAGGHHGPTLTGTRPPDR